MPRDTRRAIEPYLHDAAKLQADKPHRSSLPPAGQFVERVRVDDQGHTRREFFGKESFIKSMSSPGRRVMRLINPKTGEVLLGPPRDRIR
jgi:hypothetical protein